MRSRNWTLYVLRLEHNKYYVGITSYKDVMRRYSKHVAGTGARWTKLHKPLELLEATYIGYLPESVAVKVETERTMQLMDQFGIHAVRGGGLCKSEDEANAWDYNKYSECKITRPAVRIPKTYKYAKATSRKRMKAIELLDRQLLDGDLSWLRYA